MPRHACKAAVRRKKIRDQENPRVASDCVTHQKLPVYVEDGFSRRVSGHVTGQSYSDHLAKEYAPLGYACTHLISPGHPQVIERAKVGGGSRSTVLLASWLSGQV